MKFYLKALIFLNLLLSSDNSIAENKSVAVFDVTDSKTIQSCIDCNLVLETSQENDNFISGDLNLKTSTNSRLALAKVLNRSTENVMAKIDARQAWEASINAPKKTTPFSQTLKATILDTPVANYVARIINGEYAEDALNPNYNPYSEIKGTEYEQHWEYFLNANGPTDVANFKKQIDREVSVRETLALSSVASQLIAVLLTLPLDPINFIPVAGIAYKTIRTGRFLAGSVQAAVVGAISSGLSEAALHANQITRTTEESVFNIVAIIFLSGVLGGVAGLFRPTRRFINDLKEDVRMIFSQFLIFNFSSKLYLGIGILLLLATMPLPYGYYTFLKIITCGFSALLSYRSFNSEGGDKSFWSWLFLLVAILFNPIASIHMDKGVWIFIDVVLGCVFCLISYKIRILEKK